MSVSSIEEIRDLRAKLPQFWINLTRQFTSDNAVEFLSDSKVRSVDNVLRLYTPANYTAEFESCSEYEVVRVENRTDVEYHRELGNRPGLLMVAPQAQDVLLPYVVPGGRFNEMYGWDSYFISLGLLHDERVDMAANMLKHFIFEINNYGKVLNGNRTYYLGRSQPPLMMDLALRVHKSTGDSVLLEAAVNAGFRELKEVWSSGSRYDEPTGLSKYAPPLIRLIPTETEQGHFDDFLAPIALQEGTSVKELIVQYNSGAFASDAIDEMLRNDQGVRESGHDTSTRLQGVCADLATIDLNSLLFKYERDLIEAVKRLPTAKDYVDEVKALETANAERKKNITKYLWDNDEGVYFDYNTKLSKPQKIVSATCLWALWAGVASREQADRLVNAAIPKLEYDGGLACTPPLMHKTGSRPAGPPRQWDYPNGWAPHQILAWQGLVDYGFTDIARRLATKWTSMVAGLYKKTGTVVEKYNVTDPAHGTDVSAEYGNQGDGNGGFGWTNASISVATDEILDLGPNKQ